MLFDIVMFFLGPVFFSESSGSIIGAIASLFATVGASVFLGTSCGDRCLRNPKGAQAICWLVGISLALSLAAIIAGVVDIAVPVCWKDRDYYDKYGSSCSTSPSSYSYAASCSFTTRTFCYGGSGLTVAPVIGWHVLLGLVAALCLWKTIPAANITCCTLCAGNSAGENGSSGQVVNVV